MARTFYEFFAGGGMVTAALRPRGWSCVFANDICPKKARAYTENWGDQHFHLGDICDVSASALKGAVDLSWGSFPCTDLSLAGDYVGLAGKESGTFWPFWQIQKDLIAAGRGPRTIILENVYGALTSNDGKDFSAIASAFSGVGYRFGALIADAAGWLPHSRPRLFIIGIRGDLPVPVRLNGKPDETWHPRALLAAHAQLSATAKKRWVWWNLPKPGIRNSEFVDLIEDNPTSTEWHSAEETANLLSLMAPLHEQKLQQAITLTRMTGSRMVGGVYRRTRAGKQRAEVRFDGVAGCLRTASGGSSRQTIILVDKGRVRTRLLSTREAARLMGLDEGYHLPSRYNEAYDLCGDGVAVPVVKHLAEHIIEPTLEAADSMLAAACAAAE